MVVAGLREIVLFHVRVICVNEINFKTIFEFDSECRAYWPGGRILFDCFFFKSNLFVNLLI